MDRVRVGVFAEIASGDVCPQKPAPLGLAKERAVRDSQYEQAALLREAISAANCLLKMLGELDTERGGEG